MLDLKQGFHICKFFKIIKDKNNSLYVGMQLLMMLYRKMLYEALLAVTSDKNQIANKFLLLTNM